MKAFFILLFLSAFSISYAQTWRSVDVKAMGPFAYTYGSVGSLNNHNFRINPYNNSIWLTYEDAVQQLDNNGHYFYYNNSNTSVFPTNASFRDFAFTPQYTFAISGYYGLYQMDGNTWGLAVPFNEGINLAYDADSVWCIRTNQHYIQWYGGFNSTGSHSASRKAEIKKGLFWTSGENSGIVRFENNLPVYYSPDTTLLMDWDCWDMKFYTGTDSLFVANSAGFAIADGSIFIDSICTANCTNMPTGIILEFEFDSNNNIWALIGTSNYNKTGLAHYNVGTKVWDQYYDGNNSPINFGNSRVSIEIDNLGNLWVADNYFVHVLDEGNAPQWLSVAENEVPVYMNVYPNPAKNNVTVQCKEHGTIRLLNLQGEVLQQQTIQQTTQVSLEDLSNGTYLIELITEEGKVVKQVVKQ